MSLLSILKILNRDETFPNSQKRTLRDILSALWAEAANNINGVGLIKQDGTIPLTADWDVGAFDITAKRLISDVATGTAPLVVSSTTAVANLKAASVVTNANLTGPVTSVGNATAITNGTISNAMLANGAVASLSGTNTGDQTSITGNAGTVTTNANLTGPVTSVGNATSIANGSVSVSKLANGTDGELITWDSNGVATTVAVGTAGHTLTSNGAGAAPTFQLGMDFSANAGTAATGAATTGEELTHYEEGTWTLNVWDSSLSSSEGQTYAAQTGTFTRIGRMVFINGSVTPTSKGTLDTAHTLRIGPLPYTCAAVNASLAINNFGDIALTAPATVLFALVSASNNYLTVYANDTGITPRPVIISEFSNTGYMTFSGFYQV